VTDVVARACRKRDVVILFKSHALGLRSSEVHVDGDDEVLVTCSNDHSCAFPCAVRIDVGGD
jgi:hypothetical protein